MAATLVSGDTVVIELDGQRTTAGRYVSSDTSEIVLWTRGAEQCVTLLSNSRLTGVAPNPSR